MQTLRKWHNTKLQGSDYEAFFISKSHQFKQYPLNMYKLNRACLRIQHAWAMYHLRKNGEKLEDLFAVNIAECKVDGLIELEKTPEAEA